MIAIAAAAVVLLLLACAAGVVAVACLVASERARALNDEACEQ